MDWGSVFERTFSAAFGLEAMVYALAAIGLNIHVGYTGLLNFGHIAFMAAGAYGLGMTVYWMDLSFWLGIPIGIGYAVVLALLLGIPTLRLRADYLAITTIAASEIVRIVVRSRASRPYTGASEGIGEFTGAFHDLNPFIEGKRYEFLGGLFNYGGRDVWVLLVGWPIVIIALVVTWQLMRSPWGRVLRAIREDEDAARALGKSAYSYKLQSLVLGGVFAAIAGMLQVTASGSVQPDTFGTPRTFILWTIMIIGGIGRVWGPVAGSIIFWGGIIFIDNLLGEMLETSLADELERWLELSDFNVQQVRFIVMGLALILFMRFRPQGLFGDRQEAALDDR